METDNRAGDGQAHAHATGSTADNAATTPFNLPPQRAVPPPLELTFRQSRQERRASSQSAVRYLWLVPVLLAAKFAIVMVIRLFNGH